MFKKIGIVLICVAMAATVFAGCSKKNTDNETPSGGLEDSAQEFGFEEDKDGNTVAVEYDGDKAYVIDDNGNRTLPQLGGHRRLVYPHPGGGIYD